MKRIVVFLVSLLVCAAANAQSTERFIDYVNSLPAASLPLSGSEVTYMVQAGVSKRGPLGTITGPGLSVVGDLALWNNTSGTALKDGGNLSVIGGNYIWTGNQVYNVFDPGLNSDDLTPFNLLITYDQNIGISPGFSDANGMQISITADHGNYVFGTGTNAKTTFIGLDMSGTYRAAGQRFIFSTNLTCAGIGDCATFADNVVQYATYPRNGDEGSGWGVVSSLSQPGSTSILTVTGVTRNTCNTTTTQSISGNGSPPFAQTVTVASGTGCTPGTWIVVNHETATASPNHEAVQIISSTSNSITAAFAGNYNNGTTITPAVQLSSTGGSQLYGEGRVIVDLTSTPYTTGTVTGVSGGALIGSGTGWSNTMLSGGTAIVPGCITLAADDFTGSGFAGGGTNTLHDYYQIETVTDATHLAILSFSVAGDTSYKGKGPGAGTYKVLPCAEILRANVNVAGDVILDTNGFTWNVNDQIEETIPPYPDVSGFQYQFGAWSAGGTYRTFMDVNNTLGARKFQTGIQIRGSGGHAWGADGGDDRAYGVGLSISNANTGLQIGSSGATSPNVAAISLPGGTFFDGGSTDIAGRIQWGNNSASFVQPNSTNGGMDFHMVTTSPSPVGLLSAIQPAVNNGPAQLAWTGFASVKPFSFALLPTCASAFEGAIASVKDANVNTWGATITAGSSTNHVLAYCDGTNWTVMGS